MNIILASGSPRRKELLEQIGLKFEVIPAKEDGPVRDRMRAFPAESGRG